MQAPPPPPPDARRRVPDVVQQLVQQHRADQKKKLEDVLRRNRSSPNQASPRLAALLPTATPTTWRASKPASSPPRWASFAATVALPEDLGDGWRAGGHSFVGRETVRAHGERGKEERMSSGVVVAWLPATVKDPFRDREGQPADCLLYTSPSPRDATLSRMPSSA